MPNYVIEKSTNFDENALIRAADNYVPIYSQYDPRWACYLFDEQRGVKCNPNCNPNNCPPKPKPLPNDCSTIGSSGCGVMAMTMVINYWAKKKNAMQQHLRLLQNFSNNMVAEFAAVGLHIQRLTGKGSKIHLE
jgi:hypothetical protein